MLLVLVRMSERLCNDCMVAKCFRKSYCIRAINNLLPNKRVHYMCITMTVLTTYKNKDNEHSYDQDHLFCVAQMPQHHFYFPKSMYITAKK